MVALEALSMYAKLTREASSSGLLVLSFPNEVGAPSFTVDESSFDAFNTAQIAQRGTERLQIRAFWVMFQARELRLFRIPFGGTKPWI